MKNCAEWEVPIALWVEGDGGEGVDQHLAQCPACREFAGDLRESQLLLHGLAEEPLPVGAVRMPAPRRWRWWVAWPAFAAACAFWMVMVLRPVPEPEAPRTAIWAPPAPVPYAMSRPAPAVVRETKLLRMQTEDEDVVIYWIADGQGDRP
jgi:hypothetical protein